MSKSGLWLKAMVAGVVLWTGAALTHDARGQTPAPPTGQPTLLARAVLPADTFA